jgi:O-antigen ligase
MMNALAEKTMTKLLAIGAPAVTIFVVVSTVTDPVNVTKMWVVGGVAVSVISVTLFFFLKEIWTKFRTLLVAILAFLLASLNAVIQSDAPLLQNIYGAYGRNTGFLTYLFLSFIMIGALTIKSPDSFKKIILGLVVAGAINVVYCAWVLVFGDFIPWNNPYGNILGLFGNPNFIGSFLGIFCSVIVALSLGKESTSKQRVLYAILFLIAAYEIKESKAIQGIVVTASGVAIVGFFYLRSRFKSWYPVSIYIFIMGVIGTLSLLGALQRGPFDFIYKRSVSLRGAYWDAGITMGSAHPFSGVGMDSYGDWYRRARSVEAATNTPGLATVTNAAHNVVIDFFAYGGYPLLLSYLFILILGSIAIVRVALRTKGYDAIFVAMSVAWACYHLQSIISINQIGLAIWGWLFTGLLIAYEFSTRQSHSQAKDNTVGKVIRRSPQQVNVITPNLISFIGLVLGLVIAAPPMSADVKWRSALESQDALRVVKSLDSSLFNPVNSQQLNQAVQLFMGSNLTNEAREAALKSISFNPDSFDAWRLFYFLPNSSEEEKQTAKENMQRIDPLNPDVTKQ